MHKIIVGYKAPALYGGARNVITGAEGELPLVSNFHISGGETGLSVIINTERRLSHVAVAVLGVLLMALCGTIYVVCTEPYVLPGVDVAGLGLAGLTREEAEAALVGFVGKEISRPLILTDGVRKWKIDPVKDLGLQVDIRTTVLRAHLVGRSGTLARRLSSRFRARRAGYTVDLCLSFDEARFWRLAEDISVSVNRNPQSALVFVGENGTIQVTGSRPGRRVSVRRLAELIREAVISPSERTVVLPVEIIEPRLTAERLASLGVVKPLASYSTRFDASDRERSKNIEIAAETISGYILAPGEIFSFNAVVGPRDGGAGYRRAPVIMEDRLIEDVGGGVCQVSSTLYNAALLAGLEIVARSSHSLPPSYVPLGRDATVAFDYLDLRFRNTTPGYVLILVEARGGVVTARLFGTPSPRRRITIQTEIIRRIEPGTLEKLDESLPPGKRIVEEEGSYGYDVKVWRNVSVDGRLVSRELLSVDHYRSRPTIVRVGPSPPGVSPPE